MRAKKQPFIFGLNKPSNEKHYHCPTHQGARLLPFPGEESLYQCPLGCGPVNITEVKADTKITSRFAVVQGKQIAAGHNRSFQQKVYSDKYGNKINPNDKDVLFDIAQGRTIEFYHTTEDVNSKEQRTHVVKR